MWLSCIDILIGLTSVCVGLVVLAMKVQKKGLLVSAMPRVGRSLFIWCRNEKNGAKWEFGKRFVLH